MLAGQRGFHQWVRPTERNKYEDHEINVIYLNFEYKGLHKNLREKSLQNLTDEQAYSVIVKLQNIPVIPESR